MQQDAVDDHQIILRVDLGVVGVGSGEHDALGRILRISQCARRYCGVEVRSVKVMALLRA
jgi:hypothetical protein